MKPYNSPVSVGPRKRPWHRRYHRWLGVISALFVFMLALSGIALNHGHGWELDRKHVSWAWLLKYYGIEAPAPSGSYSQHGHRVTRLGEKLYFDRAEIAGNVDTFAGLAVQQGLFVIGMNRGVSLYSFDGELVDRIDLGDVLPGPIQKMGAKGGRAVIRSGGQEYIADADLTDFKPANDHLAGPIDWSQATPSPEALLHDLRTLYLARALTAERVLADLHSGRILGPAGVWFMDFIALCLIVLAATGLYQWWRGPRRR